MLANQFIFKELSPDVFALNRLASVVDTGKSVEELKAKSVQPSRTFAVDLAL